MAHSSFPKIPDGQKIKRTVDLEIVLEKALLFPSSFPVLSW